MQFALDNKNIIIDYYSEGMSTYEIAEKLKTYPKKIERALKFLGVELRTASERARTSLKRGRSINPMTGPNKVSVKTKLSESLHKYHENLTPSQKETIIQKRKEVWSNLSNKQKNDILKSRNDGLMKSAKEGSNFEKFLHKVLLDAGYMCYHHRNILENEKLEVDLWIPSLLLAIEFDGPSHRLPIWGEEKLEKQQLADSKKNGLILSKGFRIIRVTYNKGNFSQKRQRDLKTNILKLVKEIELNGSKEVRYLEVI